MMAKKKEGMHKMPDGKMMKNSAMKMSAGGAMPMKMKDGKKVPIFMNKGGSMPEALAKHAAKPASKAHAGLKTGGMAYAKGGGIESKGKTKGKMIKMNSGGKAC